VIDSVVSWCSATGTQASGSSLMPSQSSSDRGTSWSKKQEWPEQRHSREQN
jgi:hypothetical protein